MDAPIKAHEQCAADAFYASLGRAIAKWSSLEAALGAVFWKSTGMSKQQARAILHSAKSWRGKYDLLMAALEFYRGKLGEADALRVLVEKANQYARFRNILAHSSVQISPPRRGGRVLCLRAHSASIEPDDPDLGFEAEHIDAGAAHIDLLTMVLSNYLTKGSDDQMGSPERMRYLISLLPYDPCQSMPTEDTIGQFRVGVETKPYPR